uniref:Uncharacterized protein n=1 Tax=Rhizophora mucronata TaxID=61149 RepID=A0A2P2JTK9_RHIMU
MPQSPLIWLSSPSNVTVASSSMGGFASSLTDASTIASRLPIGMLSSSSFTCILPTSRSRADKVSTSTFREFLNPVKTSWLLFPSLGPAPARKMFLGMPTNKAPKECSNSAKLSLGFSLPGARRPLDSHTWKIVPLRFLFLGL